MLMFEDGPEAIDELKSAGLEASTLPSLMQTISHAATLSGVGMSSFVVSTAYTAAQATIEAHKVTTLEGKSGRAVFFHALEKPLQPTRRLSEAFALRKTLIADAG